MYVLCATFCFTLSLKNVSSMSLLMMFCNVLYLFHFIVLSALGCVQCIQCPPKVWRLPVIFLLPYITTPCLFKLNNSYIQAVNWFLYSYITPIFWVKILYSEKPPIFPIFSYILNIIPIFFSELVAVLLKTLFFLSFFLIASLAL